MSVTLNQNLEMTELSEEGILEDEIGCKLDLLFQLTKL